MHSTEGKLTKILRLSTPQTYGETMPTSIPDTTHLFFRAPLPSLPQTLVRLLDVCNDLKVELPKIGEIVGQDIAVTVKILKLANSAFIGARSKFHTIDQAVIYLGRDTVKNLVISLAVYETFRSTARTVPGFNIKEFWHHSLLVALLAKEIAELCNLPNPAEFYLTGLLHDIGKYLISICFQGDSQQNLTTFETTAALMQQEKALCGLSHPEAGALLARHWNLTEPLAQAIALHHEPPSYPWGSNALGKITALANLLAVDHEDMDGLIQQAAVELNITPDILLIIRAEQQESVLAVADSMGITTDPIPLRKQPDIAIKNPTTLAKKVGDLVQVHGILDNLIKAQTTNRVLQVLEESLNILFDITKSVLLLPDEKALHLVAKGSFRNPLVRKLRDFNAPLRDSPFSLRLKEQKMTNLSRSAIVPAKCPEMSLFAVFEEKQLLFLSFALSKVQRGLLVFSCNHSILAEQDINEESLLLLMAHVATRLELENIQRLHADALARERITTIQEAARTLAHEIANPVAIIGNYLSLLHSRPGVSDEVLAELQIIGNELERIGKISGQLNSLATPSAPESVEPINILETITSTLQLLRQSMPVGKDVSMHAEAKTSLPTILVNKQALQQILLNLLSNSLDAVGNNGWITVECRHQLVAGSKQGEIVMEVIDSGPGITPAIVDRLFRAGYTTKGQGHAGLGLAIVKKLTSDLHGRILHRTGENGATHFILSLPAIQEPTT